MERLLVGLEYGGLNPQTITAERIDRMTRQQVCNLAGKLMEAWQDIDAVAKVFGCPCNRIRRWHLAYRHQAAEGEQPTKMPGRPPKLSAIQEQILHDIIFTKMPLDMNHHHALWSNLVIRDIIEDLFSIHLSLGSINTMTRRMGIIRRNIFKPKDTQGNLLIGRWLRDRFPSIRERAQKRHARLLFIHDAVINAALSRETAIRSNSVFPNGHRDPSNPGACMLSAICPRNAQRFMIFTGAVEKPPWVEFLKGLIHDFDRPLFLIAELQDKRTAMEAEHFLSSRADQVSLFFLPGQR